jgi:pSer/pThr/pTyr-binding forkhead associated (FHA) protein
MFLVLLSGSHKGKVYRLEGEGVLGRDPGVEYSIDDPTVSRRHAEMVKSGEGWRLRDLGSANGTEINGVRLIGDKALRDGDVIGLGRITLA